MGILLGSGFDLNSPQPIDRRLRFDTLQEMLSLPESCLYDGLISYCKSEDKNYQWKSTNDVDQLTARWRELTVGNKSSITSMTLAQFQEAIDQGLINQDDFYCTTDEKCLYRGQVKIGSNLEIDDNSSAEDTLWSSKKIEDELAEFPAPSNLVTTPDEGTAIKKFASYEEYKAWEDSPQFDPKVLCYYPEEGEANNYMPSYKGLIIETTTLATLEQVKEKYGKHTEWKRIVDFTMGVSDANASLVGQVIDAGLPNITGTFYVDGGLSASGNVSGAFRNDTGVVDSKGAAGTGGGVRVSLNASRSSNIYGKSSTVQPPAYGCYKWERIA